VPWSLVSTNHRIAFHKITETMAHHQEKKQKLDTIGDYIVFHGCVVHTPIFGELLMDVHATIVVSQSSGLIIKYFPDRCEDAIEFMDKAKINRTLNVLGRHEFILPGFIDCHIHAPQFSFTGTGLDLRE
jgi:hypothetical protein